MDINIKVVTVNSPAHIGSSYFRLSLYEFKGDPPIAYFVKDLGSGSWEINFAYSNGRRLAKEMGINFIPGISMGDSIDKIFKHIFK